MSELKPIQIEILRRLAHDKDVFEKVIKENFVHKSTLERAVEVFNNFLEHLSETGLTTREIYNEREHYIKIFREELKK